MYPIAAPAAPPTHDQRLWTLATSGSSLMSVLVHLGLAYSSSNTSPNTPFGSGLARPRPPGPGAPSAGVLVPDPRPESESFSAPVLLNPVPPVAFWKYLANSAKKFEEARSCSSASALAEVKADAGRERKSASYSALRPGSERT